MITCLTTLLFAMTSPPTFLGTPSNILSSSTLTAPVVWITETVSQIVAVEIQQRPAVAESPILSVAIPVLPLQLTVIVPAMPIESTPSRTEISPSTVPPTTSLTVTETTTITRVSTSSSAMSTIPSSPTPPTPTLDGLARKWSAPIDMEDFSTFNISKFSSGRRNLEIVRGSPAALNADDDIPLSANALWKDSGSLIQVYYPEGSINPAQRPVGGAQFYAHPMDLTGMRSVTLVYSVFFPDDFKWVLGGKLPGLFGGRQGCSGGDAAEDCFSTRLMWRKHGVGEMYLYAPKDKQTSALCEDPQSVCDTSYGFSVGRGSFRWTPGAWTTVRQIVTLNTPGKQDGSFMLDVDGVRVIQRHDIFYRHVPPRNAHTIIKGKAQGGLGGVLGPLLGGLLRRELDIEVKAVITSMIQSPKAGGRVTEAAGVPPVKPLYHAQQEWKIQVTPALEDPAMTSTGHTPEPTRPPSFRLVDDQTVIIETEGEPIGFRGLFFSTFFGGHDERYATPTDQYVWFKDFAMSNNG